MSKTMIYADHAATTAMSSVAYEAMLSLLDNGPNYWICAITMRVKVDDQCSDNSKYGSNTTFDAFGS